MAVVRANVQATVLSDKAADRLGGHLVTGIKYIAGAGFASAAILALSRNGFRAARSVTKLAPKCPPAPSAEDKAVVAMIVGETGTGKSRLSNALVGKPSFFREGDGLNSVTGFDAHAPQHGDFELGGRQWRVFDTVGFRDTGCSVDKHMELLAQRAPDGVSVFLFAVRYGRFNESHARVFEMFLEAASPAAARHLLLVFTHARPLLKAGPTAGSYFRAQAEANQHLRSILNRLREAQGHELNWVAVELESEEECCTARTTVLEAVEAFVERNAGSKFSNAAFTEAAETRAGLLRDASSLREPRRSEGLRYVREVHNGMRQPEAARVEIDRLLRDELTLRLQQAAVALAVGIAGASCWWFREPPEPPATCEGGEKPEQVTPTAPKAPAKRQDCAEGVGAKEWLRASGAHVALVASGLAVGSAMAYAWLRGG